MPNRRVRIVDDPHGDYEVLCETESTKVLVSERARYRRDAAKVANKIVQLRQQLERAHPVLDISGNLITGP